MFLECPSRKSKWMNNNIELRLPLKSSLSLCTTTIVYQARVETMAGWIDRNSMSRSSILTCWRQRMIICHRCLILLMSNSHDPTRQLPARCWMAAHWISIYAKLAVGRDLCSAPQDVNSSALCWNNGVYVGVMKVLHADINHLHVNLHIASLFATLAHPRLHFFRYYYRFCQSACCLSIRSFPVRWFFCWWLWIGLGLQCRLPCHPPRFQLPHRSVVEKSPGLLLRSSSYAIVAAPIQPSRYIE